MNYSNRPIVILALYSRCKQKDTFRDLLWITWSFQGPHMETDGIDIERRLDSSIKYLTFGTTSTKTIRHVLLLLVAPWLCGLNGRGAVKFICPRYLFVHVVGEITENADAVLD